MRGPAVLFFLVSVLPPRALSVVSVLWPRALVVVFVLRLGALFAISVLRPGALFAELFLRSILRPGALSAVCPATQSFLRSLSCLSARVTANLLLGAAATACSPSLNAIQPSRRRECGVLLEAVCLGRRLKYF